MKKIILLVSILSFTTKSKAQTPNRIYEIPETKQLFYITEPESSLDYPKYIMYGAENSEPNYLKNTGFKKYTSISKGKAIGLDFAFSDNNQSGSITFKENNKTKKIQFNRLEPERFNEYLPNETIIKMLTGQRFWYKSNGLNLQWEVKPNEIKEVNVLSSFKLDDETSVIKVFVYSGNANNRYKYYNGILNLHVSVGTEFYINTINCESFTRK